MKILSIDWDYFFPDSSPVATQIKTRECCKSVCKVPKSSDTKAVLTRRAEAEQQMSMYERGLTTF